MIIPTVVTTMHPTLDQYGMQALALFTRRTSTTSVSNLNQCWWSPSLKKDLRRPFDMDSSKICFLLQMVLTSYFVCSFGKPPSQSKPPRLPSDWNMMLAMEIRLRNWYESFSIFRHLLELFKIRARFLSTRTDLRRYTHEHIGREYGLRTGCAAKVITLLTDDDFIYKCDVRHSSHV